MEFDDRVPGVYEGCFSVEFNLARGVVDGGESLSRRECDGPVDDWFVAR